MRQRTTIFILFLLLFTNLFAQERVLLDTQKNITKIAFGSCNFEFHKQPLWPVISENNPDLWIWLGDVVYADTEDMELMQSKFDKQLSNKNYREFLTKVPVIGIWDDHDFGGNNQGINYPMKKYSQQIFLDFIGEPQNTTRRTQEGIYTAYVIGSGKQKVKIILLDTRYFKEKPGAENDILGETQWQWFENELKHSAQNQIPIHIIASGIQFLSDSKLVEKWNDYPKSKARLYELFEKYRPSGLILISGDVHYGEILEHKLENSDLIIREITSSGMTHSNYPQPLVTNNKYSIDEPYIGIQFGMITIDWDENPKVTLQIKNRKNKVKGEYQFEIK